MTVYERRPDLKERFPDIFGQDDQTLKVAYEQWLGRTRHPGGERQVLCRTHSNRVASRIYPIGTPI